MTHNLESSEKSVMPILKTKHTAFGSRLVYKSAIWGAMRVYLKYSLLSYLFNNSVLLMQIIQKKKSS